MCTLVLSSAYFEGELTFVPDLHVRKLHCTLKEIWFQDDRVRSETLGKVYEEWMISCQPEERYASFQAEYFISRVYNSTNEVFVYRWTQDSKIVVENKFGDVRFKIY